MGPELDLRPQLERLDRLSCWSEDIDERALSFAFRPLWQLDEPGKAALALSRAQATQVYAGLKLWPDAVMARLAEAQLIADGTYPNAAAVFAEGGVAAAVDDAAVADAPWAGAGTLNYLNEKRNRIGEWTEGDDDSDDADAHGEGYTGNDLLNFVNWRERKKRRLKAKRHGERARKREREERRRQEQTGEHGAPTAPGQTGDPPSQSELSPTAPVNAPKPPELQDPDKRTIPPQAGEPNLSGEEVAPSPVPPSSAAPIGSPQPSQSAHAPEQAIRFGNNPNQILHAFRHTDDAGLDRKSVESAVRGDLISRFDKLQDGLNYGRVTVSGQSLDYNAYKFSNGDINVGRVTIPK